MMNADNEGRENGNGLTPYLKKLGKPPARVELHDAAIPALTQSFAAAGMQLLTAHEFTDTPAHKQAYDAYRWEASGFTSLMQGLQSKGGLERSRGTPDGHKLIEMYTRGNKDMRDYEFGMTGIGVGKFGNSVGYDLAKALDVDAVVIMYSVVQAEKDAINMRGIGLYMFGLTLVPFVDSSDLEFR